jgi:hypothetical protein
MKIKTNKIELLAPAGLPRQNKEFNIFKKINEK